MPKVIDMTGEKIGKLTVIERDYNYSKEHNLSSKGAYWKCKCDCGNVVTVLGSNLRKRPNSSCGCIAKSKMKAPSDLTGMTFGYLTVIKRDNNYIIGGRKRTGWICKCICGTIKTILRDNLVLGKVFSCGCKEKELLRSHLEGKRFGKLLVLEDTGKRREENVVWKCLCDCGNIIEVRTNCLTCGGQISCGCIISKGERKISQLLKENNILFETQKIFETCKDLNTGYNLRFDFYINNSFLLEYDGKQHFHYSNLGWNTKEQYELTHKRDLFKNQWCKDNNIILKRIPYTDLDKFTFEDIMSDKYILKEGYYG